VLNYAEFEIHEVSFYRLDSAPHCHTTSVKALKGTIQSKLLFCMLMACSLSGRILIIKNVQTA